MPAEVVAVAEDGTKSAVELLDAALADADFDRFATGRANSSVLILLDLGAFERDSAALPSRALVERLIDRLDALGWQNIAIASTADSSSTWADNRSVPVLADLFGYVYETPAGTAYDILDLSEDLTDGGFPAGSVLAGCPIARAWLQASVRIVLAKAAADVPERVVLGTHALIAALPLTDKDYWYRFVLDRSEVTSLLLDRFPVAFAIVDGIGVPNGSTGRAMPRASSSAFVVTGANLLAVDCIAAGKLGADPASSPLLRELLRRRGWPALGELRGPPQAVSGFRLPDPWLLDSARWRDASPFLSRLIAPWLRRVDTSLFPFKNPIDGKINAQVAPRIADPDRDPAALAWLIYANTLCAALEQTLAAWRVNNSKDQIDRRIAGVSPETLCRDRADYEAMQRELDRLQEWLGAPEAWALQPTLHWRELDGATIFSCRRRFPLPFDAFVARVDISRAIQYMNDYLGGTILVLECDGAGRPVRQVERNLYLPQPNYLAWWGAAPIDVSKIESVLYGSDRQRMYWKTIKSENASATYDDGIIEFRRDTSGTLVTVFGRQRFTLPPAVDRAALDRAPAIKTQLVEHAYRLFFTRTFSNFEALCEGRDIALGRAACLPMRPDDAVDRPIDVLGNLAERAVELLGPWLQRLSSADDRQGAARPIALDRLGYAHFRADAGTAPVAGATDPVSAWIREFWSGYGEALGRDLARIGEGA